MKGNLQYQTHQAFFASLQVFVPESTNYLIIAGREDEARVLLRKLRGPDFDVEEEIRVVRANRNSEKQGSAFKQLLQPDMLKKVLVVQTLFFIQNFCGYIVISMNVTRIFQVAGSTLSDSLSTALVFGVQLLGMIPAFFLMDRLGRKHSLALSLGVCTVCLSILATYLYASEGSCGADGNPSKELIKWSWVPLASLMVYRFAGSIGLGTVPLTINAEYFPTRVRAQAAMVGMLGQTLYNLLSLHSFTPLREVLSTPGLYYLYAAVAGLGTVFTLFMVKETSQKTMESI